MLIQLGVLAKGNKHKQANRQLLELDDDERYK